MGSPQPPGTGGYGLEEEGNPARAEPGPSLAAGVREAQAKGGHSGATEGLRGGLSVPTGGRDTRSLCWDPTELWTLGSKRTFGNGLSYPLLSPRQGEGLAQGHTAGGSIADQRGTLLPCHSHSAVFLSPQSTELPLWQLPPGAPVSPRSQTPSEVSWGPSGGTSAPWLIQVLRQSEPHPLFPTFPFLEDPGDPQGERAQIE